MQEQQPNSVTIIPTSNNKNKKLYLIFIGGCIGVIALGVIFAVIIAMVSISQRSVRDNERIRDLTSIKVQLEECKVKNQTYPIKLTLSSSGKLSICDSSLELTQKGGIMSSSLTSSSKEIIHCGDDATAAKWSIVYAQRSSSEYVLCTTLENGKVYDLSSNLD